MPHIVVEYSDNLRERVDVAALIGCVHDAALTTGVFPLGGTRTRGSVRFDYKIADGDPRYGFIHIVMRIGQGRDQATKSAAAETVFQTASAFLDHAFETAPLALSLEMQEIDSSLSFKRNTIHDDIQSKQAK